MSWIEVWQDVFKRAVLNRRGLDSFIAHGDDLIAARAECASIAVAGQVPSILCLHGFTGVPHEVRLGCEVAASLGLAAFAPLLPGHGTSSLELAETGYEDWLGAAQLAFDELRARGPVFILGLSMGSLLATELTLRAPGDVLGLILVSNAFWLPAPYPAWALAAADQLKLPNFRVKKGGSDIFDEQARRSHVSYSAQPISGAIDVLRAGQRLRLRLDEVHRPTLILHGGRDRVCPVENAWRVAERLGSAESRVVIFPKSHHILTRDCERNEVAAEVLRFVSERLPVKPDQNSCLS